MILFNRRKKNVIISEGKQYYALFQQWEKKMRKLACYLQRQSELISRKSRKAILILFAILFSAISILIIINASAGRKSIVDIKQISTPSSAKENLLMTKPDSVITQQDYKRIERFKTYLLQLKADSINKEKFDSIIKQRPHLLDSITLFEKMYLSQ